MRRGVLVLALLLAAWTAYGPATGDETRTFTGHYRWDAQGDSGSLDVVFAPAGEGTWTVSFEFNFRGPHNFRGTAEGSLDEGALTGEVSDDRGDRQFTFRGSFKKGKFRGTHFESTGGRRRKTGSLSLREK